MSKFKLQGGEICIDDTSKIKWDPILRFVPEGAISELTFSFGWKCGSQTEPSVGIDFGSGGMVMTHDQVKKLALHMNIALEIMNGHVDNIEIMKTEIKNDREHTATSSSDVRENGMISVIFEDATRLLEQYEPNFRNMNINVYLTNDTLFPIAVVAPVNNWVGSRSVIASIWGNYYNSNQVLNLVCGRASLFYRRHPVLDITYQHIE